MTLGEKLKFLREQRGWTQFQAAERLGISSQVVSNYERDYRSPDKETLSRIAKVYNCSLDWLLGVTDNPERTDDHFPSDKKDKPEKSRDVLLQELTDDPDDFFFLDGYLDASETERRELRRYFLEIKKQLRENSTKTARPPSLLDITNGINKDTEK